MPKSNKSNRYRPIEFAVNYDEWGSRLVYPDLSFGFGLAWSQPNPEPVALVKDVLSSLAKVGKYSLPAVFPNGAPIQPPYIYNTNKIKRIDHYLKQRITSEISGETVRREDVVDIGKAAQRVMDGLAEINHPVLQALVAADSNFGMIVPPQVMDQVNLEVLKQTHWPDIEAGLNLQIVEWQMDRFIGRLAREQA